MVKDSEVIVRVKQMFCPNCDVELKNTGRALMSNPPQHVYVCPKCNEETVSLEVFPKVYFIDSRGKEI